MDALLTPDALIALVTLTALEIVLGIDNIIFIAILSGKLPPKDQPRARVLGLGLAMVQRILLLLVIGWVMRLDSVHLVNWGALLPDSVRAAMAPDPHAAGAPGVHGGPDQILSVKELILLVGGLFLLAKSVMEIHHRIEGDAEAEIKARPESSFRSIILQILMLDIVFSIDSVLTAVGVTKHVPVMIAAVVLSVIVMMVASGPIARFVNRHQTIKMLALAILFMIGVLLVAEGLEFHFPRGYLYFGMAFAFAVEMLNIRAKRVRPAESA